MIKKLFAGKKKDQAIDQVEVIETVDDLESVEVDDGVKHDDSSAQYYEQSRDLSVENVGVKAENRKIQQQVFEATKGLERSIIEVKDSKIKFLTKLAIVLSIVVVLLGVAIIAMTPLKTSVPYLLRVDRTTGYVDKVEPYNSQKNTVDQAVVRYFIAKYVENREAYDWFLIQNMYNFVEETSSANTFASYKALYLNETYSPLKKLGKSGKIDVTINSITFLEGMTAQIRYTKTFLESDGKKSSQYPETTWIATMSFDFSKPVRTEKQRLLNPLGFTVNSYKVDREALNEK